MTHPMEEEANGLIRGEEKNNHISSYIIKLSHQVQKERKNTPHYFFLPLNIFIGYFSEVIMEIHCIRFISFRNLIMMKCL